MLQVQRYNKDMDINIIAERQQIKTQRYIPTPLQVASWEARRFWANHSSWRLALISFGLFLLVAWLFQHPGMVWFGSGMTGITYQFSGTSAYGTVNRLYYFSFLLALLLPLLNSGGVARDLKHRTHELLMTTPVPTWVYIIGRYLFCLLASVGMALLMLSIILLMGLALHLTERAYLAPQFDVALSLWAVAILPTTVLISSLSFALGTLLPRHANLAALGVIVAWYLPTLVLSAIPISGSGWQLPLWYKTWEPTNIGMSAVLQAPYQSGIDNIMNASGPPTPADGQHVINALQALEQKMPDLLPWLAPHLVWVGIGLALVLLMAFTFKRFRRVLNG
jgi:ABC-type transport system involved in multi-copper enzyme maturation permease subunit